MRKLTILIILPLVFLLHSQPVLACSLYKITLHGKTFVGCNEDAWRITPRIWFEAKNAKRKYGAAFTGSRFDGANGFAPQSGMNEVGLSFSRLASHTPIGTGKKGLMPINNPTDLLKSILHSCRTVREVQELISQYDRSIFMEDVFIYIEKSGKYLIVEPFSTQIGSKSTYVLSNFCPSITSQQEALSLKRYRKGVELLKLKQDTNLTFLRSLSDSMHVCRPKIGDGTLLSSIWDLNDGMVHLYFYHDYSEKKTFRLKDELQKGDHHFSMERLFSRNSEFEHLGMYKTTKNSKALLLFMMGISISLFCISLYFLIRFCLLIHQKKYVLFLVSILSVLVGVEVLILCTHQAIFYFEAPYEDRFSQLVSMAAYVPNLLLISIFPLLYFDFFHEKNKSWIRFDRVIFRINNIVYLVLIGFFFYWKLFFVS